MPSDGGAGDEYADSVQLADDVLAVGSTLHDGAFMDQGAVYLYTRSPSYTNHWSLLKKVLADDPAMDAQFGNSMALGEGTLFVGAPGHNGSRGTVYCFGRDVGGSNNWGLVTNLVPTDVAADDEFGSALALQGPTLLVGARGSGGSGSVYTYYRSGQGRWSVTQKLSISGGQRFGRSIAVAGSVAVVGDDNGNAAHLYHSEVGAHWQLVKTLTASNSISGDDFGKSVAVAGDLVAVGAIYADFNGDRVGAAYLFSRHEGGADQWGQVAKLEPLDQRRDGWFGDRVGIVGNVVAVGASGRSHRGAAYVFGPVDGATNQWIQVNRLDAQDGDLGNLFGDSLHFSQDRLLIGAAGARTPFFGPKVGALYEFTIDFDQDGQTDVEDADDDNDGMSDWSEGRADTSPQNATSFLGITNVACADSRVWLSWQGGYAATQILEVSANPQGSWSAIYTNRPPTSTNAIELEGVTVPAQFYRIAVP